MPKDKKINMSVTLSALRFNPVYCYRIWGGDKLRTVMHKEYREESIGESWEISSVHGFETTVCEGAHEGKSLKQLIQQFKGDLMGESVYETFGNEFPLLIKYIDAAKPLSIQVHPSDELARKRHDSFGKNEMWYVMGTNPGAELIIGFNRNVDKTEYQDLLESDRLMEVMNALKVRAGDAFYIPTGRVHAIGAGVLLAEIQQTSDVTYRIFDYNRVDQKTGKKRELHNELALDAMDFSRQEECRTDYEKVKNHTNHLVHSPYFKTNFIPLSGELRLDHSSFDSFVIYMCVKGKAELEHNDISYSLNLGQTLLIPAICDHVKVKAERAELLQVFV
jgi:mannose-6-phosphate isomerase